MTQSKGFTLLGLWALTSVVFDSNARKFVRALAAVAAVGLAFESVNRIPSRKAIPARSHPLLKADEFVFERVETIEIQVDTSLENGEGVRMAAVTLYRFKIELSDLDRNMYESLDFRVAMHPSETTDFLLTRVLAFALSYEEGLEFSPGGLSDTEEPAIKLAGKHGSVALAIEIGNPSGRRLHKNSKAAEKLKVYTYKDPNSFLREVASFGVVHKAAEIEAYALDSKFLDRVAGHLERDNKWSLLVQEGQLTLGFGDHSEATELKRLSLVV